MSSVELGPLPFLTMVLQRAGSEKLMEVLDQLNAKGGRGTLYFAGQGIQQQWAMKREMLSPRYTTRFSDLLRVK